MYGMRTFGLWRDGKPFFNSFPAWVCRRSFIRWSTLARILEQDVVLALDARRMHVLGLQAQPPQDILRVLDDTRRLGDSQVQITLARMREVFAGYRSILD